MRDKTATHSFPAATIAVRVVIATFFPQFAFGLSYVWIGLAPHVRQENGWSSLIIGVIFALTPLSSALTLLVSGRLATMFPPRRLCWLGMGLLIAGLAVAFVLPNEFTFLVFYALLALGVGYGIILPASLAAIAQVFPKHLGTAGGALTAAYALAAIAEVPVISLLISGHSWIDALRIVGIIVTTLAVIALLFMPPLPKSREQNMEGILPLHLLKQPHLLTSVLLVVSVAPLGTYATSQVGIYAQDLGLIAAISTAAVIFVALGNTIGRLVGGIASDYLGVNRVLFVIVILDVVAAVLLWRTSSAGILVAASGVVGLACGGLIGTVPRLATDAAPGAFNSATGLLFAGFSLGGFIGPVIGSALGGRTVAWLVLGGITVFGLIIIVLHMVDATR
jgi:MFS transporter, OFA family, oxalate/formate antiporter